MHAPSRRQYIRTLLVLVMGAVIATGCRKSEPASGPTNEAALPPNAAQLPDSAQQHVPPRSRDPQVTQVAPAAPSAIVVPNFSFEEPVLRDEDTPGEERFHTLAADGNAAEVPGWRADFSEVVGAAGVIDPGNSRFARTGGNPGERSLPGTGHAHQVAFITHNQGVSCLTTTQPLTTVTENTTFTATVAVGFSLNSPSPGTVIIKLLAGNRIAARTRIEQEQIRQGNLTDFSASFSTRAHDALAGEELRVRLSVSGLVGPAGFAQATFDNVRVTATPAPADSPEFADRPLPIEEFANPKEYGKPKVYGSASLQPYFEPGEAPTDAVKLRYKCQVTDNDCFARNNRAAWKIVFLWHVFYGPGHPKTYTFESNVYSGRSEYRHLSRRVAGMPLDIKYFEAESCLFLSVPDNRREGNVGAKSRSPNMFPTLDQEIDGFKDLWKREQVSQANLNGKELAIEIDRGDFVEEHNGWNVGDKLPVGKYRIWRSKAFWDDKTYTVDFALPDAGARYYDPTQMMSLATEAFYINPGLLRVYYWDFELQREGRAEWEPISKWKMGFSDAAPGENTWGMKVARFRGRPAIEVSNDGTRTYARKDDIIELK